MLELRWIDHIGSIEGGIELANKLYWNISVTEDYGKRFVKSGEKAIFVADNSEATDAFLYGLSLAYAVLPPHLFEVVEQGMKELLE
jgi:hypothetical protein